MSNWYDISNKSDIDYLNDIYGGFHDACITELRYISGADVDNNLSIAKNKNLQEHGQAK
ncbi:hypothetical protein [Clostridium sp. BL-8]|uniref:hypothetical protein n=1 Tax=Clostridium sp. BL-8 TaxID=349938 RepID=UPI0009D17B84|nr:hypothetical protein [Clostridium sp. BL-8]OOM77642.1 hypothetical protein CLOBL_28990 [Clostridium sp. BL-8]